MMTWIYLKEMSRDAREGPVRTQEGSKGICQADTGRCTMQDTANDAVGLVCQIRRQQ